MAEIIQSTAQNSISSSGAHSLSGAWQNAMGILTNPLFIIFIIFLLVIILIVVILYPNIRKEEELKERDDTVYATFKAIMRQTIKNKNKDHINKRYSLRNLLILGIPLWWNEHSMRFIDLNRNILGWYRGDTVMQSGETFYAYYKTKKWFFFENIELMRCPNTHTWEFKEPIYEEVWQGEGKNKKKVKTQNIIGYNTRIEEKDFSILYEVLPNTTSGRPERNTKEIQIQCFGLSEDNYFTIPNFVRKFENGKIVSMDIRPELQEKLREYTLKKQFDRHLADANRYMDEAGRINPHNSVGRFSAEKTEEEIKREQQDQPPKIM